MVSVLVHCGVGKNWAGPFFPPSRMFGSFYLSSRLLDYDILLLYLSESLDLYQAENQVFKPTSFFRNCRVGKDWASPFFSPSLIFRSFYWSFHLTFYVTLSLYFNIYERPIPKWESSFQSNKIIGLSTLWCGERLGRPILSPSKMFGSFYLSSRLLDYVILLLYLNSLDLYQAENQDFKPTSLFVIVAWGKTGPAHSFPPP